MRANFIDLSAAADFMGPGAIEVNRYQNEITDIVRRRGIFGQRVKQVPATGHPSRFFEETDIPDAELTAITSTTVSVDCGALPPSGGGFEVRRSDANFGPSADRNLVGRFTTQTFSVPRLTRVQTYAIRAYDAAGKYSRYSTVLHVDYPY